MQYDIPLLNKRRKALGLNRRNVADRSGVKYSTVLSVFSGNSQSPPTILKVARALELGLVDILIK